MYPPESTIADLMAKVDTLTLLVEQQGVLLATLVNHVGQPVCAAPDDGPRRRRRYGRQDYERIAAELVVVVRRCGGQFPDDAALASDLGVPAKTFGKWRRDPSHPVGRTYAVLIRQAAGLH